VVRKKKEEEKWYFVKDFFAGKCFSFSSCFSFSPFSSQGPFLPFDVRSFSAVTPRSFFAAVRRREEGRELAM
jgi:hypothetical protein